LSGSGDLPTLCRPAALRRGDPETKVVSAVSRKIRGIQGGALAGAILSLALAANAQLILPWENDDADTQPSSLDSALQSSLGRDFSAGDFADSVGPALDESDAQKSAHGFDTVTIGSASATGADDPDRATDLMQLTSPEERPKDLDDQAFLASAVFSEDTPKANSGLDGLDNLNPGTSGAIEIDAAGTMSTADSVSPSSAMASQGLFKTGILIPNLCALAVLAIGAIGFALVRRRRHRSKMPA
jgi:hypothetical protein